MPIFGEFETVGDPVQVTDERGHLSTVWQARKANAADPKLFGVKYYLPRPSSAGGGETDERLGADRSLEFLEGVKQLKKAQAEGGLGLVAVHDLGLSDGGAWFVTDFYQRGSLKAWISRRGGVDNEGLRHILYSAIVACRSLKRSRGYSHGNLKPSNIFLVGKSRPLRKTPILLSDPYPSAPLQLAQLDAGDQGTTSDLLKQVMEAQDLRALGELLLQLVEGRLVRNAYDYNYPIAISDAWQKLGKAGDRWRQLCNRLLDPQLSLEAVNLDLLERELRPNALTGKLPVILAGAGVVCLVVGGVVFAVNHRGAQRELRYSALTNAAAAAFQGRDFAAAVSNAAQALRIHANDTEMQRIRSEAEAAEKAAELARREQTFQSLSNSVVVALSRGFNQDAVSNADAALAIRQDSRIASLRSQAQERIREAEIASQRELKFQQLTNAAWSALNRKLFDDAASNADLALEIHRGDPALTAFKAEVPRLKRDWLNELQFQQYTNTAMAALGRSDFDGAVSNANLALGIRGTDTSVKALLTLAQQKKAEWQRFTQQEQLFQQLTNAAWAALGGNSWAAAKSNAQAAAKIRQDPAIARFIAEVDRRQGVFDAKQAEERQYLALSNTIVQALARNAHEEAISNADFGLKGRQGDRTLVALRDRAIAEKAKYETAQTEQRQFQALTNAIAQALARNAHAEAISNADFGLMGRQGDRTLLALKDRATAEKTKYETAQAEQRQFQALTNAIAQALARNAHAEAISNADFGLRARQGDPTLLALKSHATAEKTKFDAALAEQRQFQALTNTIVQALARNAHAEAISNADFGLRARQGDRTLLSLKDRAVEAQKQHDKVVAEEQQYRALTNAVGLAIVRSAFEDAKSNADYGLKIRQGDPVLLALKARAAAEEQRHAAAFAEEQRFQELTNTIGQALTRELFEQAISNIGVAEKLRPNHRTLAGLKSQADEGKRRFAQFQTYTNSAGASLAKGDPTNALQFAEKALELRAGDKVSVELKRRAELAIESAKEAARKARQAADLQFAQNLLKEGSYDQVAQLCSSYQGVPEFAKISAEAGSERKELEGAKASFDRADYTFIERLKALSFSSKTPFRTLLEAATAEKKLLDELQALQRQGSYSQLKDRIAAAASISKPPFDDLRKWLADNDPSAKLNLRLRVLQAQFGTIPPFALPNGQRVEKLRRGTDVDYYRNLLKKLLQDYTNERATPDADAVNKLKAAMDNFS